MTSSAPTSTLTSTTTAPITGTGLAQRLAAARPSKVREVFAEANRPGVISFAGGAPALGPLPFDVLARDAARILADAGPVALQYSDGRGTAALREQICALMADEGIDADPEDVIVTAGSQLALDLLCRVLLDPGDVVVAEAPSYAGGLAAIASWEAEIVQVETDEHGIVPAAVQRAVDDARAAGTPVKLVYAIPTYQNPSGTRLPEDRRADLVRVCRDAGVLLVEDNPYGMLGFDGRLTRAMAADHPDDVAYLGSFSKIFAPGLRLGWVLAPRRLRGVLAAANETAMLNPPTLGQLQLAAYLADHPWRHTLGTMRGIYRDKCAVMVAALREHMPAGVTWTEPEGGFYVWLELPDGLDSEALVYEAIGRGVVYVPGTAFYVDGRGHAALRLSFCLPSEDDIRRGIAVLGDLFTEALARPDTAGSDTSGTTGAGARP